MEQPSPCVTTPEPARLEPPLALARGKPARSNKDPVWSKKQLLELNRQTDRQVNQKGVKERWAAGAHLFQWVLELRYSDGNMMGRILAALSLIRLMMYSLFQ